MRPAVVPHPRSGAGNSAAELQARSGPTVTVTRRPGSSPVVRRHDDPASPPHAQRRLAEPATSPSTAVADVGDASGADETKRAEAKKLGASSQKLTEFTDLIEAIEDRVLAQLERRGGRYQGVF